jgi:hypothetical protein
MTTNLAYTPIDDLKEIEDKAATARAALPHIHIGLNTTVRATRGRPERERRALRWLSSYIHRERLTAEAVCGRLDTSVIPLRAALTDADADVKALIPRIESLRAILDSNLREPAETQLLCDVKEAFDFAIEKGALVEYIDITRTGKTTVADWLHLTHLDRAVYVDCTSAESYAAFVNSVARGCGIRVSEGKKGRGPERIEAQIDAMLGAGGMDVLILDEGHYLWPTNIKLKPRRIEYVRKLWDRMKRKLAIVILSTPQSVLSSNMALSLNKRWSPGQWDGRINRFYPPTDEPTLKDAMEVARWHLPNGSAAMIEGLAQFALASVGLYGAMVNALDRAQFKAKRRGEKLSIEHIKAGISEAIRGTKLGAAVAKKGGA